ncbi:MAG: hypothetical protein NVSMB59_01920 [Vulcanimicrobiaceae bacterium]
MIATGGTSLRLSGTSRASETVWTGAGSGCSAYETQPSWQTTLFASLGLVGCANRAVADVAYDADPATGVAVYDSLAYRRQSGWLVFGGTSVAAPAIAAIYALAGTANASADPASFTYANYSYASNVFDVTSGSNGTCSPTFLCTGAPNDDGPTGLGTPIGTLAF